MFHSIEEVIFEQFQKLRDILQILGAAIDDQETR